MIIKDCSRVCCTKYWEVRSYLLPVRALGIQLQRNLLIVRAGKVALAVLPKI